MDKLTIEQKAKAYDEALKQIKECTPDENGFVTIYPNEIFPELAESEDEKIRKTTIAFLKEFVDRGYENAVECIDWLEKQSHTDSIIEKAKTEKQRVIITETDGNANIDWDTRSLEDARKLLECGLQYINTELEKQCGDKVEPKFKVGDCLVNIEYGNVVRVLEVLEDNYRLDYGEDTIGTLCTELVDNDYRLWDITKDAKDGDVLATDSWLYIFKYTNHQAVIKFHCSCPINGKPWKWCFSPDETYLDIFIEAKIHPATKEQREQLEKAMADAGYRWNKEELKLERI